MVSTATIGRVVTGSHPGIVHDATLTVRESSSR